MTIKLNINQFKQLYNQYGITHPINVKGKRLATELLYLLNAKKEV